MKRKFEYLKRIALVTPSLRPVGGTEIHVRTRIQTYLKHGIEVHVFTQDAPGVRSENTPFGSFTVEGLGETLSESLSPGRWLARGKAVQALADRIVQTCQAVDYSLIVPLDLINALQDVVCQYMYVHTPEYTCPAGGRYLPHSRAVCTYKPGVACLRRDQHEHCLRTLDGARFSRKSRLRTLARRRQSQFFARRLQAFVYNSEATRQQFHTYVGNDVPDWVVHPPIAYAQDDELVEAERNAREILFVGRLTEIKGVLDAIDMMRHLPQEWTLTILGDGPALPEATRRVSEYGLQARVALRGWADRAGVQAANRRCAIAIVPSLWFEAWGMVGPEALAQGCAVAAYDSGGIREWCHGPGTCLVKHGDVEGLAAGVLSLADLSATIRADMASTARTQYGTEAYDNSWAPILAFIDDGCGSRRHR